MIYFLFTFFGIISVVIYKYNRSKTEEDPYARIYLKNSLKVNGVQSFFEKHEIVLKNGLPNIVKIYNCFPKEYFFNPPTIMKTKELRISAISTDLKINWEKFKNLEIIYIFANTLNIEDLVVCRNLSKIKIKLNKPIVLPSFFYDLQNLDYIKTNMIKNKNKENNKITYIDIYTIM